MLMGAAAFGIGIAPVVGGATLVGVLSGTMLLVHSFWNDPDPVSRAVHRGAFFANAGLLRGTIAATVQAVGEKTK
jgi:uncharacterized membrane protein YphA (DoxX/SURF4 family)